MTYDHDESVIKNAYNKTRTPEYDIFSAVQSRIQAKGFPAKKVTVAAVAVCLCLMLSVLTAAANLPSFNRLLSHISPDIAWAIRPVEMSCEDEGIRMEVVAAGRYDAMVKLYVTLKDLDGNRFNEDTFLLDRYGITDSKIDDGTHSVTLVELDSENHTVTLLIETLRRTAFTSDKLTFTINGILTENGLIPGDWSVTFKAQDGGKLETECSIGVDDPMGLVDLNIEKVSVNPFGATLTADGQITAGDRLYFLLSVVVNTENSGVELTSKMAGYDWESGKYYVHFEAERPIDMGVIKSVTVNGETLIFK